MIIMRFDKRKDKEIKIWMNKCEDKLQRNFIEKMYLRNIYLVGKKYDFGFVAVFYRKRSLPNTDDPFHIDISFVNCCIPNELLEKVDYCELDVDVNKEGQLCYSNSYHLYKRIKPELDMTSCLGKNNICSECDLCKNINDVKYLSTIDRDVGSDAFFSAYVKTDRFKSCKKFDLVYKELLLSINIVADFIIEF